MGVTRVDRVISRYYGISIDCNERSDSARGVSREVWYAVTRWAAMRSLVGRRMMLAVRALARIKEAKSGSAIQNKLGDPSPPIGII